MENFTNTVTALAPSCVGMPVYTCASAAAVDSSALIVRERRAAVIDGIGWGFAVMGDVKRGLGHVQTTTSGTRAWRPPS